MGMADLDSALVAEASRLLSSTLTTCSGNASLRSSADALLRLSSSSPAFPLALLAIAQDADTHGLRIASATYLKNFITQSMHTHPSSSPQIHTHFRNQLALAVLRADQPLLKVLIEAFRPLVTEDFVGDNSWPELIPQLKLVIQNSNLICQAACSQWKTLNALTVLQTLTRPFQYFLNPKLPKEPVPEQLEQLASEILVPLQTTFHHFVDKVLSVNDDT